MIKVSIGLEIFTLCILFCLLVNLILDGKFKRKDSFLMALLIPDAMLYIAANLVCLYMRGNPAFNTPVTVLSILSFFFGYVFTGIYLQFITVYAENKKLIKIMPKISISLGVLLFIPVILSPFTGWCFTIENGTLIQSSHYALDYIYIYIAYILLIIICITQKKIPLVAKITSFITISIHLAAIIGQTLYPNIKITYCSAAIVVLMSYTMVYMKQGYLLELTQKELSEAQISMTLSKIQPHFLFNSLTSISQLCRSNPELAHEAIDEFAKYLRMNMDCLGNNTVVDFSTELSHTQTYLKLEKLRYEERLNIVYDISCDDFKIPSLTLQPIVENAVRHGIAKKDKGGTIKISTHQIDSKYVIVINDDGVGFNTSDSKSKTMKTLSKNVRSHIGLENVEARLKALCNGHMEIASRPGKGTTISLYIPSENK